MIENETTIELYFDFLGKSISLLGLIFVSLHSWDNHWVHGERTESSFSKIPAKLPLTTLGDIGVFDNNKLVPNVPNFFAPSYKINMRTTQTSNFVIIVKEAKMPHLSRKYHIFSQKNCSQLKVGTWIHTSGIHLTYYRWISLTLVGKLTNLWGTSWNLILCHLLPDRLGKMAYRIHWIFLRVRFFSQINWVLFPRKKVLNEILIAKSNKRGKKKVQGYKNIMNDFWKHKQEKYLYVEIIFSNNILIEHNFWKINDNI